MKSICSFIGFLVSMIGYHLHGSILWSIFDFFFWYVVLVKWVVDKQLTLTVIQQTFSFFFH